MSSRSLEGASQEGCSLIGYGSLKAFEDGEEMR